MVLVAGNVPLGSPGAAMNVSGLYDVKATRPIKRR